MQETLKMMKGILNGKERETNEKELIKQYKDGLLPNILAYFYTSNIGIISRTDALYPVLDSEDKASFCLQELDKSLQNFNLESSNKFITYFIKCYKNRLRMETEQLLTQKRKIALYTEELNDEYMNDMQLENIDMILSNYNLNDIEVKQCKLLNAGYTMKEIAKIFKQSTITIYKRNNKIKEKISTININFA
jgi:hypothetical protein